MSALKKAKQLLHAAATHLIRGLLQLLIWLLFRPKLIFASEKAKQLAFSSPQVIAYNHVKGFDGAVIYTLIHKPMTALSAQDLIPNYCFLPLAYRYLPLLAIDRQHASLSWLRECRKLLKSGQHILFAPEGFCNPDKAMRPFKPGCVMLAAVCGVQILPVYHNAEYHPIFGRRFRMIVGEPVTVTPPPEGVQAEELNREAQQLRETMQALEKQLNGFVRVYKPTSSDQ